MTDGGRLSFEYLISLVSGRFGITDVPCPICSATRRKKTAKCFRVWRELPDFLTYCCVHCNAKGSARADQNSITIVDADRLTDGAKSCISDTTHGERRDAKARFLWGRSLTAEGSLVGIYLKRRGIICPIPSTLRFLPPSRDKYQPAMIAAFGLPLESEPGKLDVRDLTVCNVHLTKLTPDGTAKAKVDNPKITVGPACRQPIVLAPINDGGGLAIAEGIEDALSVHQATGLGAWAAGGANRLPPLADIVPAYVSCVTIMVDDDDAGRRGAMELAQGLWARGITVEFVHARARS